MDRDRLIKKNISLGVLYKIFNLGIVFITLPILLKYLGTEQYGVWVTLFSIINTVIYLDGGIINGLKTKLAEVLSVNDFQKAKSYISSAYILLISFSLLLLLIGSVFIHYVNFQNLLNTTVDEEMLKAALYLILFTFIIGFVLNIYKPLFYASQQSSVVELSMLIYQIIILVLVLISLYHFKRSLIHIAIIYGASSILTGLFFTLYYFRNNFHLVPSVHFFKKKWAKPLFSLSVEFFIIQLSMIVIFSTDNIIISKLLGPDSVTKYDVVLKLFQVLITFFIILQDPYWAMYAHAYKTRDFQWIRKTFKKWNLIFLATVAVVFLMVLFANKVIKLWLQTDLEIPFMLIVSMGIFVVLRVFGIIYMYFLNGIGKVRLQMWLYVFGALINIPLSIYFVKGLNLGAGGVVLGTISSLLVMTIILPIQSFSILKNESNKLSQRGDKSVQD